MVTLADFETLEDAQNYTEVNGRVITSDIMTLFLVQNGLYSYAKNSNEEILIAVVDRLLANGDFNFIEGTTSGEANKLSFDYLIAVDQEKSEQLLALKDTCIAYCNPISQPFLESTEIDFNEAKGIYETEVIKTWANEAKLIIDLKEDLPRACRPTLFVNSDIYDSEPVGRTKLMSKAGRYVIQLSGLSYLHGSDLHIAFPCAASVEMELR